MTKKDYIILARAFGRAYKSAELQPSTGGHLSEMELILDALLSDLMEQLAIDNPRFDEKRFCDMIADVRTQK